MTETQPPNIVWLVADHQPLANRGPVATSFALQSRLAREGTSFDRAYTALPICSPARASMLTGLYPHAHGLTENDGRFGGRESLDPTDWMIHQPLLEAGYRCAWFGKWHVDNHRTAGDFGFEGWSVPGYGYPYGEEAYRAYLDRHGFPDPVATIELPGETRATAGASCNLAEVDDWFAYESGSAVLQSPAQTHEAFFVSRLAQDWIESLTGEPFFVRVDPWGPHPPYITAQPFDGMIPEHDVVLPENFNLDLTHRPQHHRDYRDGWHRALGLDESGWRLMARRALEQTALVEAALAGVLDTLDRLGLAENTLVIFNTDHGDAVASNGGVANKGGLMVEETLRIPLALRGPGVAQGARRDALVSNMDVPATILEACGLNAGRSLHGQSLMPLLRTGEPSWRTGLMTQHYGLHAPVLQRAWHQDTWKLVVQEDGFIELYDLKTDPAECRNLANEPEHGERLLRMLEGLQAAMHDYGDHALTLPRLADRLVDR
jgi:arylsulfatase A-like enzyme